MEIQPSFERVVGGSDKEKKMIEALAEQASQKTGAELYGEYLASPTEEERKSIESAVVYANRIAKSYGASKQFTSDRIFLLESGGVKNVTNGKIEQGVCNWFSQTIAVDRSNSNSLLATTVVHEMFHMNCYHSHQIVDRKLSASPEGIQSVPYRSGISMRERGGENNYFGLAEEAIIATLSKRFFDEVVAHDELYKEEIEKTAKIKEWLIDFAHRRISEYEKRDGVISLINDILLLPKSESVYNKLCQSDTDDDYKMGFFLGFFDEVLKSRNIFRERAEEREKFDRVIERIVAESKGKIADRDELFDHFARAHFTGNYLPLARIIEDSVGKGTFREIAQELGEMDATA